MTENHFETGVENLRQRLLVMASRAETAVNEAVQALLQRDLDRALRVRADDQVIDAFEIEIDDLAIHLLTKAPLATNLRLVMVAMKISQNLERIGDEAAKIAKRARDLAQEPPIPTGPELPRMAALALQLVKDTLDAFVQNDSAAARAIMPRDAEINALHKQIHRQITRQMMAAPDTIVRGLHWLVAVKSLERIADHAKNIAEEIVYLCEAQDIRHHK